MYSHQRLECALQDISKESASYKTPQRLARPIDCHGAKLEAVCIRQAVDRFPDPARAQTQELTTAEASYMLVRSSETSCSTI